MGSVRRMRVWYILLFVRISRIRCFFNVCTYYSACSFTLPRRSYQDFIYRSLHLEFVLPRPPYSPDLTPSVFHRFGPPDGCTLKTPFGDNDGLKHVDEELRRFRREFQGTAIFHLTQGRKSVLMMKKNFRKNNLNFVEDAPIIILVIVPEKIIKDLTFLIKDSFTSQL